MAERPDTLAQPRTGVLCHKPAGSLYRLLHPQREKIEEGRGHYCAHNDKGVEQPCEEHEEYTEAQNDVAQLPVPGVGGWPEEAKPLLIILRVRPRSLRGITEFS